MRVGILSHADLPHIIPNFRLARSLSKLGYEIRILGSDAVKIGKGHSEAWFPSVQKFGFSQYLAVHRSHDETFLNWLRRQIDVLQLELVILDAVWQSLAYGLPGNIVIHHAGLPDFRGEDMPTWQFIHPNHGREQWIRARNHLESLERAGQGVRSLFYHIARVSGLRLDQKRFDWGCGEFAQIPAIRSMSLPQEIEYPNEVGRVGYLGTHLPTESDHDWATPPGDMVNDDRPLILCIFGTTGLVNRNEYGWLLSTTILLARHFKNHLVAAVIPGISRLDSLRFTNDVGNLSIQSWIPLWETLSTRRAPTVLVTTPGVGAFREAVTTGTPVVAIPRRLDQFGAAARIEYFGLGRCIVSSNLPNENDIIESIAICFSDGSPLERASSFKDKIKCHNSPAFLENFISRVSN